MHGDSVIQERDKIIDDNDKEYVVLVDGVNEYSAGQLHYKLIMVESL